MFEYTTSLVKHTLNQIKNVAFSLTVIMQIAYIAYLIYALIVGTGILEVNIILLVLSVAYLIFFIYDKKKPLEKQTKKQIKKLHKYGKRTMKLYSVVVMVVICVTAKQFDPITLLTVAFSIIGIAAQIILDVLTIIIEKRIALFKEAVQNDIDVIKQPITGTGNFFKKMLGKEVEEKKSTENFEFLEKLREMELQEKKEKKAEKRAKFFSKFKAQQADEEIAVSSTKDE